METVGVSKGFQISIKKRIPVGSGLGGGSSNAASTLLGMSQLMGAHLPRSDLMRMALELGADVPFFLFGRPALATGIGEHLEPLAGVPRFWLVLVYPAICISSQWAYGRANLWLTNPRDHINMPAFSWDFGGLHGILENDLERVVVEEYPVVQFIKQRFLAVGAVGALMSGSGSTVFGLYLSRRHAHQAYHQLRREFKGRDWEIFLSRSAGS
jgi:4-diphosphocytidyl-2-C-methyl-D-erythritol kinase